MTPSSEAPQPPAHDQRVNHPPYGRRLGANITCGCCGVFLAAGSDTGLCPHCQDGCRCVLIRPVPYQSIYTATTVKARDEFL